MDVDLDSLPSPKFSCGSDLASLAVGSDLARLSWLKVSELQKKLESTSSSSVSVEFSQFEIGKFNILAFATSLTQDFLHQNGDLNTVDFQFLSSKENPKISIKGAAASLVSSDKIGDFQFLCSKQNLQFSVNDAAVSLFLSVRDRLSELKAQIAASAKSKDSKPLAIAGHGFGGSVAALFTLWLLDSLDPVATKRPLCITFGSPLIGDQCFQEAVSQYSTWNSCFLHVAHTKDYFSTFNPKTYKPFGTYLFCSESGSACFESTGSVAELLEKIRQDNNGNRVSYGFDYGPVIDRLQGKFFCRDAVKPNLGRGDDSFSMGIKAQLAAIGFQQSARIDNRIAEAERDAIIDRIEAFDPTKKLNDVKVRMAQLEWYKKETARDEVGYYDSYKNMRATRDSDVVLLKKTLDIYWEKLVEVVEKKPQKADAHLRKRWLFGGTIYRRMVEPLHIADFYKVKGNRNYVAEGRPKFLSKLEEMLKDSEKPKDEPDKRRQNMIRSNMTEDSCFWAHVEDAILSCESLKISGNTDREKKAMEEFEEYAFDMIKNYGVSPEIFLKESTYMKWWKLYQLILKDNLMGAGHDSKLIRFMEEARYRKDKDGMYTPCYDDDDDDDDEMMD